MTFILKTTEHAGLPSPVGSDNEHCLYADIVSVSFRREEGGAATAHCYMREPIKTAEVPGFCEVEKFIGFTGTAYVMNEAGKTVSTFTATSSGAAGPKPRWSVPQRDPVETVQVNQFPRRNRVDYWSPAELAIQSAVDAVEVTGADLRLTDAVQLLSYARESVADFIDSQPDPLRFKTS